MKYFICATVFFSCIACSMQRNIKRDIGTVVKYAPDSFPPSNQAELEATCYRGFRLYKATCTGSGCHGSSNRGNDTIPHFNMLQLDNYDKAAKSNDPDNHAVTAKLSSEQLSDILSFLFLRTLSRQVAAQHSENETQNKSIAP